MQAAAPHAAPSAELHDAVAKGLTADLNRDVGTRRTQQVLQSCRALLEEIEVTAGSVAEEEDRATETMRALLGEGEETPSGLRQRLQSALEVEKVTTRELQERENVFIARRLEVQHASHHLRRD